MPASLVTIQGSPVHCKLLPSLGVGSRFQSTASRAEAGGGCIMQLPPSFGGCLMLLLLSALGLAGLQEQLSSDCSQGIAQSSKPPTCLCWGRSCERPWVFQ